MQRWSSRRSSTPLRGRTQTSRISRVQAAIHFAIMAVLIAGCGTPEPFCGQAYPLVAGLPTTGPRKFLWEPEHSDGWLDCFALQATRPDWDPASANTVLTVLGFLSRARHWPGARICWGWGLLRRRAGRPCLTAFAGRQLRSASHSHFFTKSAPFK